MFLIASTGRCGTFALTRGLDACSAATVHHEPEPLLREAHLKHRSRPYDTPEYRRRRAFYRRQHRSRAEYGESFRTPNLVDDVMQQAPGSPLLVLVRDPESYVISAHACRVLSKGDEWDRYRLMPPDLDPDELLAVRIAKHWETVNRYLLDAVERHECAAIYLFQSLAPLAGELAAFLGVEIVDHARLRDILAVRPNRSASRDKPEGYDRVAEAVGPLWEEIRRRARR